MRSTWLILLNVECLCMGSLENESWSLHLIWKHKNAYEVPVYWCTWYIWQCLGLQPRCDIRQVSCIGNLWDWDWTTIMNRNEHVYICMLAIEIHSDVTPSHALMRSDRRGLWWICNEFKPLPAYTKMVVSLCLSFEDFSQVFPNKVFKGFIQNGAQWWWFLFKHFPNGVSGFIFQCAIQDSILSIGILYWLEGSVKW